MENLDVDNPPDGANIGGILTPSKFSWFVKDEFSIEGDNASIKLNAGEINASAGSSLHLESSKKMDFKATEELDIDGGLSASLKGTWLKLISRKMTGEYYMLPIPFKKIMELKRLQSATCKPL